MAKWKIRGGHHQDDVTGCSELGPAHKKTDERERISIYERSRGRELETQEDQT